MPEADGETEQGTHMDLNKDENTDGNTDEQNPVDFTNDSGSSISCESSKASELSGADDESDGVFPPLPCHKYQKTPATSKWLTEEGYKLVHSKNRNQNCTLHLHPGCS